MYIDSVGPLLRIDFACWNSISSYPIHMDGNEVSDDRIHYILKSIVREVFVLPVGGELYQFLIVTTDKDPSQGKFQTISYKGTKALIRDVEKAFQTAMVA